MTTFRTMWLACLLPLCAMIACVSSTREVVVIPDCLSNSALNRLQEPPLPKSPATTSFRFTCIRSFYNTVSVRVGSDGKGHFAVFKRLSGVGACGPRSLIESRRIRVTDQQWSRILQMFGQLDFFSIPSTIKDDVILTDYDTWVLEASANDRYGYVIRVEPTYVPSGVATRVEIVNGVRHETTVQYPVVKREAFLKDYAAFCKYLLEVGGCSLKKEKVL